MRKISKGRGKRGRERGRERLASKKEKKMSITQTCARNERIHFDSPETIHIFLD